MTKDITDKILIVDDDELDRMAIRRALANAPNKPIAMEVSGAREAIMLLREQAFDCLLLDYKLSDKDGLEFIREIQSDNLSNAPIVILSGLDDEATMLRCLKEGAQDYLLKSEITTNSLIRAIRYARERKSIALHMQYTAHHDALTGLANRALFIESVGRAVKRAQRANTLFAIIFIDLDNFKSINDSMGHVAGDELLIVVAERLKTLMRAEDLVCRLGGDEFAIMVEGIAKEPSLIKIAQKILGVTREPVVVHGNNARCSASIGIATFPGCGHEATTLIKCADLAMYNAKKMGRNGYSFYSEELQSLADNYASLQADLHHALAHNEFELHYQPQVNTHDNRICGVEALIRWHHPTRGMVPPNDFIPIAESLGLINDIGQWVVEDACRQLKAWLEKFPFLKSNFSLAVNVSAHQLRQLNLKENVCRVIDSYNLPYGIVELELTESALIDDVSRCTKRLGALNEKGIRLAIDDFGTGFSSFRHLQQLPLNILKIDKSFIDFICVDNKNLEIVKAMIMMGNALEMTVIAEGVETIEQVKVLQALDCHKMQGYYFSRPLPVDKIDALLVASVLPIDAGALPTKN